MKKAAIVIPTYNEKDNIESLVKQIFEVARTISNWEIDVVIVDSASPDGTAETIEKLIPSNSHLHLIKTKKEGLGKAYIQGFRTTMETLNPFVLFEMDADHSHDPKYIPGFLKKIEQGADFVIGSRYIKGGSIPSNWGLDRKIYSIGANIVIRFGFMKPSITDWTDGFRAIKTWVIKNALDHIQNYSGYVFQVALLDYAVTHQAHIKEIPVHFIDRTKGVSKINSAQYSMQTFWYVFTHSSFIKYVCTGFFGFAVDFSFAYLFIHGLHIGKTLANTLSSEVAIVCNFFVNNFWSFKDKQITGGILTYLKKFFMFNLVSCGSIIIQLVGLSVAFKLFGDHKLNFIGLTMESWILYKILIIGFIVIPYSYFFYNKIVWKNK